LHDGQNSINNAKIIGYILMLYLLKVKHYFLIKIDRDLEVTAEIPETIPPIRAVTKINKLGSSFFNTNIEIRCASI
jgi:hypothetical protein